MIEAVACGMNWYPSSTSPAAHIHAQSGVACVAAWCCAWWSACATACPAKIPLSRTKQTTRLTATILSVLPDSVISTMSLFVVIIGRQQGSCQYRSKPSKPRNKFTQAPGTLDRRIRMDRAEDLKEIAVTFLGH